MRSPNDDEDRRDIRASLDGDEHAYARLVRRHQPAIAAQMWRFSRDATVVEELVQEAFVESYLSLAQYKARAPFIHWLRRIATRVGYRYWKRRDRDRRRQEALVQHASPDPVMPEDPTPSEAADALHGLLDRLPPEDRLVLTLHYFEELDMNEIAERMGWSRSLAKVRAFRARKKLRALLEEIGYEKP